MHNRILCMGVAAAMLLTLSKEGKADKPDSKTVRVAVIGGMTMTPLWGEIQKRFEAETGIKIDIVVTGEKPALARAMKEGKVDFLTMHSSDATTNLVADGWARDLRPWAKNDLVIIGPTSDPAGISGMKAFKSSLDVIGNNIANVNTVAYKAARASFFTTSSDWKLVGITCSYRV